ncbi:helix-turn-helix domain-containing protein [Chloroflexota bacterium]
METLKRLRKSVGLTQQKLAKYAGINRSYLAQLEAGIHKPSSALEKWLTQVMMDYHLSHQGYIMRLSERNGPSEETVKVREELDRLEQEDISQLVGMQVMVQSRYTKADWQIMSGLAALYVFKQFPGSLEMKFL